MQTNLHPAPKHITNPSFQDNNPTNSYDWNEILEIALPIYNTCEEAVGQKICASVVQQYLTQRYSYRNVPYGPYITNKVKEVRARQSH